MGLIELFEIGFVAAFWNFSNPSLSVSIYVCLLLGIAIQSLLFKKCRKSGRWGLIILSVLGILVSECAWQVITGWDRIAVDFIYMLFFCLLLGAVFAVVINALKKKLTQRNH